MDGQGVFDDFFGVVVGLWVEAGHIELDDYRVVGDEGLGFIVYRKVVEDTAAMSKDPVVWKPGNFSIPS